MEHNTAFVFPGQGSQYAGMGKDVAELYPVARRVFDVELAEARRVVELLVSVVLSHEASSQACGTS